METDRILGGLATTIRAQDALEFWIAIVVLTVICLVLFYYAFRCLRCARVIEDTPTSRLRSAAQGYVELHGRGELMGGEPIIAPLTNSVCIWWRYKIERRVRTRRSTSWRTEKKATSHSLFKLVDETGECLVDPEEAEVTPLRTEVWRGHTSWPTSRPDGSSRFGGGRYRYTEERLHAGEPLYALGFFTTRRQEMLDTDSALRDLLRDWKRDRETLLERFDADGDGEVDLAEWERARSVALREVRARQHQQMADAGIDVVAAPEDGRPFLLSCLPQEDLARRYRWKSAAALAGFFLVGALDVFMLGARMAGS